MLRKLVLDRDNDITFNVLRIIENLHNDPTA